MNILELKSRKTTDQKISMITCYDYTSAAMIAKSNVDCILVGDSSAMVMQGHQTTIPATVELIESQTAAVAKGAPKKWIVADLPFLSYRKSQKDTMDAVDRLMRAGAHAIKLEGVAGNEDTIAHIVESGVPVVGHIGLTPQLIHQLGGFKMQGKDEVAQQALLAQAKTLETLGCCAVVIECVPAACAKAITEALTIPTIGIGAGQHTDGQVLVWQDILGLADWRPKFAKAYMDGQALILKALNDYHQEVQHADFPNADYCIK